LFRGKYEKGGMKKGGKNGKKRKREKFKGGKLKLIGYNFNRGQKIKLERVHVGTVILVMLRVGKKCNLWKRKGVEGMVYGQKYRPQWFCCF
jgi:hypothetical protein